MVKISFSYSRIYKIIKSFRISNTCCCDCRPCKRHRSECRIYVTIWCIEDRQNRLTGNDQFAQGMRRSFLSLADFHSRRVPHVRLRAVTAGITMHDVTLGSNPPYLLRATMLQESETLANQVTPTSCSRCWAARCRSTADPF